jgi:hypothetical protein
MGLPFKGDGQLGSFRTSPKLGWNPQNFRRRAAECRVLAESCLTAEAEEVLSDLAADLEREASKLEQADTLILGRRAN